MNVFFNRNTAKRKAVFSRVFFLLFLLFLKPSITAYALDIDFAWTLGEFRFAFADHAGESGDVVDFDLTLFSFDVFETVTGLGIKISPFAIEDFDTTRGFMLPVELYYNPFVYRLGDWTSFNIGAYVRGGYGFTHSLFARSPGDGLYGAAGVRVSFATLPIGRTPIVDHSSGEKRFFYMNMSLFAEYTSINTFRIGIAIDNIAFGIAAIF
jgi:hypothetical protein